MTMTIAQTLKLTGYMLLAYITYKLGLEVWCVVYGLLY
jgi:hypothetical protein